MEDKEKDCDKSEWPALKYIQERGEFLAQKGLAYFNRGKIITKNIIVLDWLVIEGILDGMQQDAGIQYRILHDCARGLVREKPKESKETGMDAIIKKVLVEEQLRPMQLYLVKRVTLEQIEPENYIKYRKVTIELRDAFDALCEALQNRAIKEALDKRRERAKITSSSNGITTPRISLKNT